MNTLEKITSELEELFKIAPYSLEQAKKEKLVTKLLKDLTALHYENCKEYQEIIDTLYGDEIVDSKTDVCKTGDSRSNAKSKI